MTSIHAYKCMQQLHIIIPAVLNGPGSVRGPVPGGSGTVERMC